VIYSIRKSDHTDFFPRRPASLAPRVHAERDYHVPVVMRALDMLEQLELHPEGLSVKDLQLSTKVPLSSVYRIANTLRAHSYVRLTADGKYTLDADGAVFPGVKAYGALAAEVSRRIDSARYNVS